MNTASIDVTSKEHWARKGPVSLYMRNKFAPELKDVSSRRPPVILVHGSSLSAIPSFDLTVPELPDYSFMDWLARRGWDVWTLDHECYGSSTKTDSNSDVACGVEDLLAATKVIADVTGKDRFHLYGLSSGALRAAAFAQRAPNKVERLALDAFVWTGKDSPTLTKRREGVEQYRKNARRGIDEAMISSIFTRDEPGTSDPRLIDACAKLQLSYADFVPTGTYLDMTTKLPLVDPEKISAPVLVVRGEHDGIATMADLMAFFEKLPNGDRQFSVLAGLAHCTPLGLRRHVLWQTVDDFLRIGEVEPIA
ncbi:MAG: alpha/beta hydrolase [Rhodobiaceae bacterium]|nr:alpha/beta hydrolase [Rhodobiaceae bacterium]MCC0051747.1 alpha/beta hydrolase [Rhodobiaceae bacterium]MCC0060458.1 alpha/beta hydrolase [Rhodobiaceae bacterium]